MPECAVSALLHTAVKVVNRLRPASESPGLVQAIRGFGSLKCLDDVPVTSARAPPPLQKRDFYADVRKGRVPEYDILVTNPPYSGDHKERILKFCMDSGGLP